MNTPEGKIFSGSLLPRVRIVTRPRRRLEVEELDLRRAKVKRLKRQMRRLEAVPQTVAGE
jgi:hypothetical protein